LFTEHPTKLKTDFLVIGSGIAGLTYAIKMAERFPDQEVLVVTKTIADETNTKYAQGGIAAVWDELEDNFNKHIDDTLVAGDGLCDPHVVDIVVREGPDRVREIIEWGARFDRDADGDYALGMEGGHSASRILHYEHLGHFCAVRKQPYYFCYQIDSKL
jgi:L-aspartate oxidase